MKSKLFICTSVLLLALSGCSAEESFSSSVDKPVDSASSLCQVSASTPKDVLEAFEGMKTYVYVWEGECGLKRVAFSEGTIGGGNPPTADFFQRIQGGFSCSIDEAAALIRKGDMHKGGYVYGLFEIPSTMDENSLSSFASCPYRYICQNEETYGALGLQDDFEWCKRLGLIDMNQAIDFSAWRSWGKTQLDELDAIYFGDYALIEHRFANHVFKLSDGQIKDHVETPFILFDGNDAQSAVGLDLLSLIKRFGMPSYVSSEGALGLDYICDYDAYRFTFERNQHGLAVSSAEKMSIWDSFVSDADGAQADSVLARSLPEYSSIATIVRKLGKSHLKAKTSTPHFAYRLDDGCFLHVWFNGYPYVFDAIHRGFFALTLEVIEQLPEWWVSRNA
ncbi:MAG: hypothetical protein J6328_03680 [Bacilli bacterium]|nr:hypothetical protein [Bacilli bacterium]